MHHLSPLLLMTHQLIRHQLILVIILPVEVLLTMVLMLPPAALPVLVVLPPVTFQLLLVPSNSLQDHIKILLFHLGFVVAEERLDHTALR
jgi:hypothetical protein